jgi:hypothetical protein
LPYLSPSPSVNRLEIEEQRVLHGKKYAEFNLDIERDAQKIAL